MRYAPLATEQRGSVRHWRLTETSNTLSQYKGVGLVLALTNLLASVALTQPAYPWHKGQGWIMQPHSVTPYGSQSPCQNCAAGVANRMHHQPTHTHTPERIPTRSAALHAMSYKHSKQPQPTTPRRPINARALCMQPEPCAILVTGTRRVAYAHTLMLSKPLSTRTAHTKACLRTCHQSQPVCAPQLSCTNRRVGLQQTPLALQAVAEASAT